MLGVDTDKAISSRVNALDGDDDLGGNLGESGSGVVHRRLGLGEGVGPFGDRRPRIPEARRRDHTISGSAQPACQGQALVITAATAVDYQHIGAVAALGDTGGC